MRRWPAWLLLCVAVSACEAPTRVVVAPPPPALQPAAPELSPEQVVTLTAQCNETARDKFRGEARSASYANHFNARMKSCFYLVTVSDTNVSKKLYDISENELYGEYLGPLTHETPAEALPSTCRVEAMHCASEREWNVLVARYMETD